MARHKLGLEIAKQLKADKRNQTWLAEELGVSRSAVTKWLAEDGNRISADDLVRICDKVRADKIVFFELAKDVWSKYKHEYSEYDISDSQDSNSQRIEGNILSFQENSISYLDRFEMEFGKPVLNARLFDEFLYNDDSDDYSKSCTLKDLTSFYYRLLKIPRKTREYLYVLIQRDEQASYNFAILPKDIENTLEISRKESFEELTLLEHHGLAWFEPNADPPGIVVSQLKREISGEGLLSEVCQYIKFINNPLKTLKDVIIECDFTLFDTE